MLDRGRLAEIVRRAFDESFGEGAERARRFVSEEKRAVCRFLETENRAIGAGMDLAHFGMDDAVDAVNERQRRLVSGEENRIALGQQRHRLASEPAHALAGWDAERGGNRLHQPPELVVGIGTERGIDAVEAGLVEELVPRRFAVMAADDFLEEIENYALHRTRGFWSRRHAARGFQRVLFLGQRG